MPASSLCYVCGYALQDSVCQNPACGGTPEAAAAFAAARAKAEAEEAERKRLAALRGTSFTPRTFTPGPKSGGRRKAAPRPHVPQAERTEYYKLARWDSRFQSYRDGKGGYGTEEEARNAARACGTYRISRVTPEGTRTDGEPFVVGSRPRK
jgi:hypothetical protein